MKSPALWLTIFVNAVMLLVLSDCLAIGNDQAKVAAIVGGVCVTLCYISLHHHGFVRHLTGMLKPSLNTIAVGLLIGLIFGGAGCAALDKAAPDFAAVPATTQPGGVQTPAAARNVPAQVAEVTLPWTQNATVQQIAAMVPFGPIALAGVGGLALLVLGSAHKTQSSNNTTNVAVGALHNLAQAVVAMLPAGLAKQIVGGVATATDDSAPPIATDAAAAAANAVSNAMSATPAPSAAAAVVASKT